jgi:hypothetical protein
LCTQNMKMVKFQFKSNAPPSLFAYPPLLKAKAAVAKTKALMRLRCVCVVC